MINITRILCPTDLSVESDDTLRYALALATAFEAKLVLLYCRNPGSIVDWATSSGAARRFQQALFTRLDADELKRLDWQAAIVETDEVGNAISEEAAKRNVDLIVMRSRRRPRAAALLGSTAETVCKTAPCPVLVTHPREREWVGFSTNEIDLHRLLIAYDNSHDADLALDYGVSLAEQYQAEVHVLHVMTDKAAAQVRLNDGVTSDEIAAQRLQLLVPKDARLWCNFVTSARCGQPSYEIVEYAKEHQIDLICMGASGTGFSVENMFGSTADRVLRQAPCPVLIARPLHAAETKKAAA